MRGDEPRYDASHSMSSDRHRTRRSTIVSVASGKKTTVTASRPLVDIAFKFCPDEIKELYDDDGGFATSIHLEDIPEMISSLDYGWLNNDAEYSLLRT